MIYSDSAGAAIHTRHWPSSKLISAPTTPENGWTGISAITVEGVASTVTVPQGLVVTTENQFPTDGSNPFTPVMDHRDRPFINPVLLPACGQQPFDYESSGGTPALTGNSRNSDDVSGFATCGPNGGGTLIYTLTNSSQWFGLDQHRGIQRLG